MRRVRIESESNDLIAGFVAGVEWVNDSAVAVVDLDYRGPTGFVVLEDRDASGKVSLEEVLIALRDDRHLLNDPDGIFSGRYAEMDFRIPDDIQRQAALYPTGFSAQGFVDVVEKQLVWEAYDRS